MTAPGAWWWHNMTKLMNRQEGSMSDLSDNNPPYHLVQEPRLGNRHIGPFSTYLDACLARNVASARWAHARILNRHEFRAHLASSWMAPRG